MNFDVASLIAILEGSFYAETVQRLFSPTGGSTINTILLILNGGVFLAALAYGFFQLILYPFALLRSNADTRSRGTVLGFTRSALVLFLLLPSPTTGLNPMQGITVTIGAAGNNLAQRTWDAIRTSMFDKRNPVFTNVFGDNTQFLDRMIEQQVCLYFSFIEQGRRDYGNGFTPSPIKKEALIDGTGNNYYFTLYVDGPGSAWNDYKNQKGYCGSIRYPNLIPLAKEEFASLAGPAEAYQQGLIQAFNEFSGSISKHTAQFAAANHPFMHDKAKMVSTIHPDDFRALVLPAVEEFLKKRKALYKTFADAIRNARVEEYTSTKDTFVGEWIQAGGYYNRISKFANFQQNVVSNTMPTFTSPQWERLFPAPEHHYRAMRTRLSAIVTTEAIDLAPNHSAPQFGSDFGPSGGGFIEQQLVGKIRASFSEWAIKDLNFNDPMSALTSKGYSYLGMYAAIFTIVGAIALVSGPLGMLAWEMTSWIRGLLMFGGVLLAIVIPIVPYVMFVFGIVGWLLPLIFFFFTGPIWLIPNIKTEGTVAIVGNGWTTLLEIFLRPTLLIVGLAVGYAFFTVLILLIETTLGAATVFSYDTILGVFVFALLQAMYGFLMAIAAVGAFMLIVLVPNALTQYLPSESSINA